MTEERVTERTDGITTERTVERGTPTHTTVIERRGGGGGIAIAIVLLVAVLIGGWYLFAQNRNETIKTDAISDAAKSVGDGAEKVGDAAQKAVGGGE